MDFSNLFELFPVLVFAGSIALLVTLLRRHSCR